MEKGPPGASRFLTQWLNRFHVNSFFFSWIRYNYKEMNAKILIIEDNRSMREMLENILREHRYLVESAANAAEGLSLIQSRYYDVILSDFQLPDTDALTILRRSDSGKIPFIIMTAYGTVERAVEAMKLGAFDFLVKPVDPGHLFLLIENALKQNRLRHEHRVFQELMQEQMSETPIIGKNADFLKETQKVTQVAATDTPVLVLGESGTGKELIARSVHVLSQRREAPFIALNSAAIPETLLENELFGHEPGAFTDASRRQTGKLELAQGGTFFLDEIGDLSLSLQGKLLRVIEERKITRIGGQKEIPLDLRFVFATNCSLEDAVRSGRFRHDLYYRINIFPITLPPLRERPEDIILLSEYFVERIARQLKRSGMHLSEKAQRKLRNYPWPGNIRELQNTIERAVILCSENELAPHHIMLPQKPLLENGASFSLEGDLKTVCKRASDFAARAKIAAVLEDTMGNKSEAARRLGINYKSLLEKVRLYGLEKEN